VERALPPPVRCGSKGGNGRDQTAVPGDDATHTDEGRAAHAGRKPAASAGEGNWRPREVCRSYFVTGRPAAIAVAAALHVG
jgi:hypothetical protein